MRKSEAKVASYVLQHANDVIKMRSVDLAANSDVSEPTVIHFCLAIGFDGFLCFKLQLVQQLGLGGVYRQFAVGDKDTVEDPRNKVFDTAVGSLLTVRDPLDPEVLETGVARHRKPLLKDHLKKLQKSQKSQKSQRALRDID